MFTKTKVENDNANYNGMLLLAPISVLIEYRNEGVGSALINTGKELAKSMGYKAIFLVGDPKYYSRFGFKSARNYDIKCNIEIPDELIDCVQVCELTKNALNGVTGIVNCV